MNLLLLSIGVILLSALASLATTRRPLASVSLSAVGNTLAALPGLYVSIETLLTGRTLAMQLPWSMPYGTAAIEIDPLTACFLIPVFALSAITSLYGVRYLTAHHSDKPLGPTAFFFNILSAAMIAVVVARNAVLFLIAWEVMSLASFFLVTVYDDRAEVRQAGFTYLIATHIGTAFLMAFFIFMGMTAGSLDFAAFNALPSLSPMFASLLFILALIGFGTKAGLMPLHVWLPEAHPAAPSHVSALMSGVMIKTGIYGIIRALTFLPDTQGWWGWLLVIIGTVSGIFGILFAAAQQDIKRLLAYSSVENIGIITIGLGIGMLGMHYALPVLAVAGFTGALLHVINHAFFKGLLFLSAGAVIQATGTPSMDELGGLIKRMPRTGAAFLVGAVAICALPPFNGFVSEFMIYAGAFYGMTTPKTNLLVPAILTIGALALIGGLSMACFTKLFGVTFLGEPRSTAASQAHEVTDSMQLALWIPAIACVAIGLAGSWLVTALEPAISTLTRLKAPILSAELSGLGNLLNGILWTVSVLAIMTLLLMLLRRLLFAGRRIDRQVTWDCGYAAPSARMEYTGASFAEPIVTLMRGFLLPRTTEKRPQGAFPQDASFATEVVDPVYQSFFLPLFRQAAKGLDMLHWLQHGSVQIYILYIAATLVILMMWKLW